MLTRLLHLSTGKEVEGSADSQAGEEQGQEQEERRRGRPHGVVREAAGVHSEVQVPRAAPVATSNPRSL